MSTILEVTLANATCDQLLFYGLQGVGLAVDFPTFILDLGTSTPNNIASSRNAWTNRPDRHMAIIVNKSLLQFVICSA